MMYIVVILLGTSVGASANAEDFLQVTTLKIIALGLIAFIFGTAGGVLLGKLLCRLTHGTVSYTHLLRRQWGDESARENQPGKRMG